jgi:hypothetical protein
MLFKSTKQKLTKLALVALVTIAGVGSLVGKAEAGPQYMIRESFGNPGLLMTAGGSKTDNFEGVSLATSDAPTYKKQSWNWILYPGETQKYTGYRLYHLDGSSNLCLNTAARNGSIYNAIPVAAPCNPNDDDQLFTRPLTQTFQIKYSSSICLGRSNISGSTNLVLKACSGSNVNWTD